MSSAELELLKWVAGVGLGVIFALVGVIYGLLRAEDKRLARNQHELRNHVGRLAMWLEVVRSKLGLGDKD